MAHKYVPEIGAFTKIPLNPNAEVFQVQPGELTRWYVVNGGPSDDIGFHMISGILSAHDGSVQNRYGTQVLNDEVWIIPPGSGSVIEITFPEEGIYVGLDHAMNDVLKGGAFAVLATPESTPDDHPAGTMVPPRGSPLVSGPPFAANATAGNATAAPAANATEAGTDAAAANQTLDVLDNATAGTNATDLAEAAPDTAAQAGANATETGGAAETGTTTGTGATGQEGGETGVSIVSGSSSLTTDAYAPNPIEVGVGDTVTWTNDDSQPHTATSGEAVTPDGNFDSGIMAPAATFDFTFTEAGEYPYFCLLHPNMVGTVSVS
jgi:plastocyanin